MRMFNPVLNLTGVFNSLTENESALQVYVRVRPLLSNEKEDPKEKEVIQILDKNTIITNAPSSSNTYKNSSNGTTKINHRFVGSSVKIG